MKIIKMLLIISGLFFTDMVLAQETILKYTDHEPLGGMRTKFINDIFFSAIEKESKGHLKIEAHWNGELAISYDALRKVSQENIADITIVVPEYSSNDLPLHQIFKSFPVGPSGDKQVKFFRRVYKEIPVFTEELEKANVVPILLCTGFPVAFFSAAPINNLEDIKGKKWRSASFWHKDFLTNAGAIPVSMPWNEEIYKALQAHTLDGIMVNVDSGYDLKVHKAAPNILLSKELWLGHLYILVINKNIWDSIAKEDQEAVKRAAETAYKSLGSVMNSSFNKQIKDLKKDGAKVRILKPVEVKQWKTVTKYKEVQSAWVKEQENKGIKNVSAVIKKVTDIINDYSAY